MAWLAQTFQGLTWKRFGLFCLIVACIASFSAITVFGLLNGKTWGEKALGPLRAFCISFLVYFPVLLAVVAVENRGPKRGRARVVWLAIALLAGHAVGALLWMNSVPFLYPDGSGPKQLWVKEPMQKLLVFGGRSLYWLVFSITATVLYYFIRQSNDAAAAMHREEFRREETLRENAEARLSVMQAQIEPHFLFNTLASVRRLYQTNRVAGREMLQQLSRYLTASLPSIRETRSTLERELSLAIAYLNVQKIRMESRLAFDVDIPAALRRHYVPPMMLATLVENAVIHGLTPLPQGGRIVIAAREEQAKLVIDVVDDGRGLQETFGGGVGLANIRSRLASEFGAEAELILGGRQGNGVIATLRLPLAESLQREAA